MARRGGGSRTRRRRAPGSTRKTFADVAVRHDDVACARRTKPEPGIGGARSSAEVSRGRNGCAAANRLALIRAICASPRRSTRPPTLPAQKFFPCVRSRRVDIRGCRKTRDNSSAGARSCRRNRKIRRIRNPHFIGICALRGVCRGRPRKTRIYLVGSCAPRSRCASRKAAGRASYAQKQLKSLLIFFCCSNPVSSARRFATALHRVAIHQARRAAMAKKRKKAAAKKPAKKRRKKK